MLIANGDAATHPNECSAFTLHAALFVVWILAVAIACAILAWKLRHSEDAFSISCAFFLKSIFFLF
jgi:hypothetical protein